MTNTEWKREKSRLTGAITRARTKLRAARTLQEKLVRKSVVRAAEDALHNHKLFYFDLRLAGRIPVEPARESEDDAGGRG